MYRNINSFWCSETLRLRLNIILWDYVLMNMYQLGSCKQQLTKLETVLNWDTKWLGRTVWTRCRLGMKSVVVRRAQCVLTNQTITGSKSTNIVCEVFRCQGWSAWLFPLLLSRCLAGAYYRFYCPALALSSSQHRRCYLCLLRFATMVDSPSSCI